MISMRELTGLLLGLVEIQDLLKKRAMIFMQSFMLQKRLKEVY